MSARLEPPAVTPPARRARITRLFGEPLWQFAALGALIFAVVSGLDARREAVDHTIVVDPALTRYLASLYRVQFGVEPDAQTLEALIDNHVREEVLFREALRMGLAGGDEIIRRRLVQKLDYLLTDNAIADPAPRELEAYFTAHRAAYASEPAVTFRQAYFADATGAGEHARVRAAEALAALEAGAAEDGIAADRFALGAHFEDLGAQAARETFGNSELSDALFDLTPARWHGPFRSGYGWHLVYIERVREGHTPALDAVREQVQRDWQEQTRSVQHDAAVAELLARYRVERGAAKP